MARKRPQLSDSGVRPVIVPERWAKHPLNRENVSFVVPLDLLTGLVSVSRQERLDQEDARA